MRAARDNLGPETFGLQDYDDETSHREAIEGNRIAVENARHID